MTKVSHNSSSMSFLCIYNWIIMIFIVERGLKAVVESHSSATKTTRVLLLHRSLSRSINTTFLISPVHWTCVVPPCLVSSKHWRFFFQSEQLCLKYFKNLYSQAELTKDGKCQNMKLWRGTRTASGWRWFTARPGRGSLLQ